MPDAPKHPSEQAARAADQTSSDADHASATADVVATSRDDAAADREIASEARDRAANARDRAAEEREDAEGPGGPGYALAILQAAEVRAQAAADRELAAADRRRATLDREEAEADRARAASDRAHAAKDREHAAMDRRDARVELDRAHIDDLTGAYRRGAGEVALQHELSRARRSGEGLVMVYMDVNGLKETNDAHGHTAGDDKLRRAVAGMRERLRSYEPIVRYGGDEFLCSISGVDVATVRARFAEMQGSVSVGLAAMCPGDTLAELIDRADDALVESRRS